MSWQEEDLGEGKKGLIRTFEFADFKEAWSFMGEVAELAESHQHHPNWTNVYNRVTIVLSTHDADGAITEKDIALAEAIDALDA
ncbi:MAG: 4a-hydroxytetrahydrobiopterin dehydratase [Flavobacteriales bacterium]|nr:4a-hydroxytetrahydrobiopterin dehydratase [Flavobacteriales bacterium]